MQIHELNNFTGSLRDETFVAVDDGTDTGKVSIQDILANTNAELTELERFLNSRIDNIIAGGDAPSEAEIIDARLGINGVVYPSLGDASRQIETNLEQLTGNEYSLTGIVYKELSHGTKTQPNDSTTNTIIDIGKMEVGHNYRIFLRFRGYQNGASEADGFGKMTAFYTATGNSGTDRVTDLTNEVRAAIYGTSEEVGNYFNLGKWIYIDYTAPAAITRLRPQYISSFVSTTACIDWVIVDMSQISFAPVDIVPDVNLAMSEIFRTISNGSKEQGGNYGANVISLGATMYAGKAYEISLYFDGPFASFTDYVRNIYVANSNSSGGRIEDIISLFKAIENPLQSYKWYTVEYTPPANVTHIGAAYSSSYVASNDYSIKYKVTEKDSRITQLEDAIGGKDIYNYTPINTWESDAVPDAITNKLHNMSNDILLVCQGDSLTGLIEYCDPQEEPEHCPPGMQYKSWTYLLWKNLARVKPLCDRLDSERNNAYFFTTTGSWEQVSGAKFDDDDYAYDFEHERSVASLTYQSNSNNAAISFTFDADTYEKCNIVFSLKPDGADCEIEIAEGSGKMLVSLDRTTWVEANGFTHSQYSNPDGLTYGQIQSAGLAIQQRHRRLWMKKATGVTGDITVTYKRSSTQTLPDPYMYCWGAERWSGNTVFVDNLGRGGRYTKTLSYNISDIFDRNPDFAMYEMPLANETDEGLSNIYGFYQQYFTAAGNNSYKTRSEDYTKVPLIVILPNGRGTFFDADDNAVFDAAHQVANDPPAYTIYMDIFNWLKDQLASYANVSVDNLYERLLNEAAGIDLPINIVFGSNGEDALTQDTTHLNQRGARMYLKYLLSLFQR